MTQPQRTIGGEARIEGVGLFTGTAASAVIRPAPVNHGMVFVRADLARRRQREIPVHVRNVTYRARRTALNSDHAGIETCEHILSAAMAAGLDNARIEVRGPEVPMADGSAEPFVKAIEEAGVVEQETERDTWRLTETIRVGDAHSWIEASPVRSEHLILSYALDYGEGAPISPHGVVYAVAAESFREVIAPARTFVLDHELADLQASGMCQHLSPLELLVIGAGGPLGDKDYRFPDEPAKHKVLDILGDLALLGRPVWARVHGHRSGHALNHALVREIVRRMGP